MAFSIDQDGNYEPSRLTKHFWLMRHRYMTTYGDDLDLPGFFVTDHRYLLATIFIFIILILEGIGLFNLWMVIPNPIFALLFTFLDFVLAIGAIVLNGVRNIAKNKKTLAKKGISFTKGMTSVWETRHQRNIIFWCYIYSIIFYCAIIFLAYLKISNFLYYYEGNIQAIRILMFAIYTLAAIFHIIYTGEFIIESCFRRFAKREKNIQKHHDETTEFTITDEREYVMPLAINIPEKSLTSGISITNRDHTKYLVIKGVLQDSSISSITQELGKDKDLIQAVAIYCLRIQLRILQSSVYRRVNPKQQVINEKQEEETKRAENITDSKKDIINQQQMDEQLLPEGIE